MKNFANEVKEMIKCVYVDGGRTKVMRGTLEFEDETFVCIKNGDTSTRINKTNVISIGNEIKRD